MTTRPIRRLKTAKFHPYKQLTNFRTIISSLILALTGVLLLVISEFANWQKLLWLQSIFRDIGSLLIASIAIGLVWELFSKRAFYAEALSESRLVDDIVVTGLIGASAKWQGNVDWEKLFRTTETVKIFYAYGRTWRNTYHQQIDEFASRPNTRATIVLPNPDDPIVMGGISKRTGADAEDLANRVRESAQDFIEIFERYGRYKLTIWYVPFAPTYSYYCFDEKAVFSIYQHRLERAEVPTFIIEKGGTLYDFFNDEFEVFTNKSSPRGKKVYPPNH
jgi:hypothetical protein